MWAQLVSYLTSESQALREKLKTQGASGGAPAVGTTEPIPGRKSVDVERQQARLVSCNGSSALPSPSSADEVLALASRATAMVAPPDGWTPLEEVPARDKKRFEAFVKLLENEREYYAQLTLMMELFYLPLKRHDKAAGAETILSAEDVDELFGNAEVIWGIHKLFLGEMHRLALRWTADTRVGPLLAVFAPAFKAYNFYTAHVGIGMVALTKFKTKHAKSKEFKLFVDEAEASALCKDTNFRYTPQFLVNVVSECACASH